MVGWRELPESSSRRDAALCGGTGRATRQEEAGSSPGGGRGHALLRRPGRVAAEAFPSEVHGRRLLVRVLWPGHPARCSRACRPNASSCLAGTCADPPPSPSQGRGARPMLGALQRSSAGTTPAYRAGACTSDRFRTRSSVGGRCASSEGRFVDIEHFPARRCRHLGGHAVGLVVLLAEEVEPADHDLGAVVLLAAVAVP